MSFGDVKIRAAPCGAALVIWIFENAFATQSVRLFQHVEFFTNFDESIDTLVELFASVTR